MFGCVTTHEVEVISVSRLGELEGYSYRITSLQENEPEWERVEHYVGRAMSGIGFYPVEEGEALVVDVSYGVSEKLAIRQVLKSLEVEEPLSIGTDGKGIIFGGMRKQHVLVEMNEPYILYSKHLELFGSEPNADNKPIFAVYVEIKSDEDNLHEAIPIMVAVALQNLNQSTDKTVEVSSTNSDLVFIKSVD